MNADGDNFEWLDPAARAAAAERLFRLAETRRLMALYEAGDRLYVTGRLDPAIYERLNREYAAAMIKAMQ